MYTLRFIRHGGESYRSYEAKSYEVSRPSAEVVEVALFENSFDEEPYFEQIGAREPYDICYVTNQAGKTIDKIVV